MRVLVALLGSVALSLACLAQAQPPSAPNPGWTAPNGRFAASFPEGWGVIAAPDAPAQVLVHFGQTTTVVERKDCFVQSQPMPAPAGQAAINALVASWDSDQVRRNGAPNATGAQVLHFENIDVSGVRVASALIEIDIEGQRARFHTRQFALAENGTAQYYALHCLVMDPRPNGSADVEALLASLQFTTRDSP